VEEGEESAAVLAKFNTCLGFVRSLAVSWLMGGATKKPRQHSAAKDTERIDQLERKFDAMEGNISYIMNALYHVHAHAAPLFLPEFQWWTDHVPPNLLPAQAPRNLGSQHSEAAPAVASATAAATAAGAPLATASGADIAQEGPACRDQEEQNDACQDEVTDVDSAEKSDHGYGSAEGPTVLLVEAETNSARKVWPEHEVKGQQPQKHHKQQEQHERQQQHQQQRQQQQQKLPPPQQTQSMEDVPESSQNYFRVALTRTLCQAYTVTPHDLLSEYLPKELDMPCSFFACGKYREEGKKFQELRSFEVIVEPKVVVGMPTEKDFAKLLRVAIKRVVKQKIEDSRRGAQGMALGNPRVRRVEFKPDEQTPPADDDGKPDEKPDLVIEGLAQVEEEEEEEVEEDDEYDTNSGEAWHRSPKYVSVKNTFVHYSVPPPGCLGRAPSAP